VQSALNNVDAAFRKDAVGACSHLLEVLMQSNNFDYERCGSRIVLHDKSLANIKTKNKYREEFRSKRTLSSDYEEAIRASSFQCVVIPSSSSDVVYEMKTDLTIEGDGLEGRGEGGEETREGENLLRAFNSCISLSEQNTAITMTLFLPFRLLSRNILNMFFLSGNSKQNASDSLDSEGIETKQGDEDADAAAYLWKPRLFIPTKFLIQSGKLSMMHVASLSRKFRFHFLKLIILIATWLVFYRFRRILFFPSSSILSTNTTSKN
jgi:hypothetical protein